MLSVRLRLLHTRILHDILPLFRLNLDTRWMTKASHGRRYIYCSSNYYFSSKATTSSVQNESNENSKIEKFLKDLRKGNRAALASAITLVETEHKVKKMVAQKILTKILQEESQPEKKHRKSSYRIGLSGPPGAGKSSFIEVFGKFLTEKGHKVAVLAVDPSSATTGGSLLGDKTRMAELTRDPNAYIRPSPTRGHLGGVTRSTNEAIVICEYAGYDIVIIETVGVGQSEYAVTNMVDIFVLLLPPGGGDELQGVKRGIIERADILLVTKSDGDLAPAAHRTQYEYMAALKFMKSATAKWKTKVHQVSSRTKTGISKFWDIINDFREVTKDDFQRKRSDQRKIWMWTHIREGLYNILLQDPDLKKMIEVLSSQVEKGEITPGVASDELLSMVMNNILKTKQDKSSDN